MNCLNEPENEFKSLISATYEKELYVWKNCKHLLYTATCYKMYLKYLEKYFIFTFSHLADPFIQSDLQMRTFFILWKSY